MLGLVTPVSRLATLSVRALVRMRLPGRTPSAANIEAGRCFHTDCQSLAHQDRSLIGDCDHALHVLPCCRFNVGPRYFPGVVRVQRLRQSAFVLRLGYIDPAESFAFPLPACTSPTLNRPGADLRASSRDGHSASLPEAQPPTRHLAPSHVAHQPGRPGSMLVLV